MALLVLTAATLLRGTAFTGTAPGPGNPTVSGTISSSVDDSDHIKQINLNMNVAMKDFTTFGDGGFVVQKPGLKGADMSIDFFQDFASSEIDATYGAAFLAGTLMYFDIKPTASARGATNPSYVYAAYVSQYPPLGVAVGEAGMAQIGLTVTGTYARLTS